MAKYHFSRNSDGTMSMRAQLSESGRVFFQATETHFDSFRLADVAMGLATQVAEARKRHGLVQVDGDVPGEAN
jgi:hypothetical protein